MPSPISSHDCGSVTGLLRSECSYNWVRLDPETTLSVNVPSSVPGAVTVKEALRKTIKSGGIDDEKHLREQIDVSLNRRAERS